MREPASLSDVVSTLSDIYAGSEKDVSKVFALGVYEGFKRYDGASDDHRVGQIEAALSVFERYLIRLLDASTDRTMLNEESKRIRAESGEITPDAQPTYAGEASLFPALRERLTINKLVGNNLRDVGRGMIGSLDGVRPVKGDRQPTVLANEYDTVKAYLQPR